MFYGEGRQYTMLSAQYDRAEFGTMSKMVSRARKRLWVILFAIVPSGRVPAMQAIQDFYISRGAVVTGDVVLASGVNIWFASVIRGDLARITLGPRVNIQDGCMLHTDYDAPQEIEEGVVVGHGAILHGRRIGRETLIGMVRPAVVGLRDR